MEVFMARRSKHESARRSHGRKDSPKVGSDPQAARQFGGDENIGIPESEALSEYGRHKSEEAKTTPAGSHTTMPNPPLRPDDDYRVSGAGAPFAGPGGASGGDVDVGIVGVGTGGTGIAQSGPDENVSESKYTTGESTQSGSGPPAKGENELPPGMVGGKKKIDGTTIDRSGGDTDTTGSGYRDDLPERQPRE
jgi:hypothetical protein